MIDTRGLVLGELAVREKLLTAEQLDRAIEEQERTGDARPLGEVMVGLGLITPEQLARLLERQAEVVTAYEKQMAVSRLFGRIAVERGYIDERQLATCLRTQLRLKAQGRDAKIGHVMIASGFLAIPKFWEILRAQGDFLCGGCGKSLETPRFDRMAIFCDTCGHAVMTLQAM